jgi:hypothetical protein
MKHCAFLMILVCFAAASSELRAETEKRRLEKRRAREHSGARNFAHKVEHAFLSVGGHLQKFFTGRDTISR